MYAYISGTVQSYGSDYLILDNNGIGYFIAFAHPEKLGLNKEMTIYTYQHVREDEISLFGFYSPQERDLFLNLISVKGVGPKTALAILAAVSVEELIGAIEQDNLAFLKGLPGIGSKTASQIILDLRGKLVSASESEKVFNQDIEDAQAALKALGYKQREINEVIKDLSIDDAYAVDEYVRQALQLLLKKKGG